MMTGTTYFSIAEKNFFTIVRFLVCVGAKVVIFYERRKTKDEKHKYKCKRKRKIESVEGNFAKKMVLVFAVLTKIVKFVVT